MIVHDVQQGTEKWHELRLARPTASCFSKILTKPRDKKTAMSKTAEAYLCQCFAEWAIGEPMDGASSPWMERGERQEDDALKHYAAFLAPEGLEVKPVGFVTLNDDLLSPGCSPDAFVGDDGGLELKVLGATKHVACMFEPERFLTEHWAQVQGGLWITGRRWWHLVAYNPVLPAVVHRVEPDAEFIGNLADQVGRFTAMLHERLVKFGYQPQSDSKAAEDPGGQPGAESRVGVDSATQTAT